jgi:hypothetical protein
VTHQRIAALRKSEGVTLVVLERGAEVLRVAEAAIQSDFGCGATGIQEELLGPLQTKAVHKAQGCLPDTFPKSPHEMPGTDPSNLRQALELHIHRTTAAIRKAPVPQTDAVGKSDLSS